MEHALSARLSGSTWRDQAPQMMEHGVTPEG